MSPERAAETARIEIVALFMPTCLSSAALVPRAQLFYILLPGASPLRGSAAGLLSCRPLSRAQNTVRLRLTPRQTPICRSTRNELDLRFTMYYCMILQFTDFHRKHLLRSCWTVMPSVFFFSRRERRRRRNALTLAPSGVDLKVASLALPPDASFPGQLISLMTRLDSKSITD